MIEVWLRKWLPRIDILFSPLRVFFPVSKGCPAYILLLFLIPQRLLLINFFVRWPVHFTSRVFFAGRIKVGANSFPGLSANCYVQARNGIEIGDNFKMGPGAGLISANHDMTERERWSEAPPIRIGNNVWLGMNAVVLPGVQIGDNSIIGAGAIVTADVPANVIAAGNPCRVIRSL